MGPGLFLVLALLTGVAKAETAVGLDARGVDPMTAVDDRQGLDVRDELGRPVTAQAVLRDMKAATVTRAAEAAYASTLPKARLILPALELASGLGLRLVQFAVSLSSALATASLPGSAPKIALLLILLAAAVSAAASAAARPCPCPLSLRAGRCCPEVLRC
ncbi:MAG: hypothetical protein HY079_01915 [Elusimicrobia bacterium]|nr:hypothetical protein [Elusimicrobiota bacterium]